METCRNPCVYLYVEVHKHSHDRAGRVAGSSIYSLVNVGMHCYHINNDESATQKENRL